MSETRPHLLIVEPEHLLRRYLGNLLEGEGYAYAEAGSIAQGLRAAGEVPPQMVTLALDLPDGDGVELIRELRRWSKAPIMVISAHAAEEDKVRALDAGADDYLTKPFGAMELLARVRALLRRAGEGGDAGSPRVEFGEVRVDFARRTVERGGRAVRLTQIEYRLLALLVENSGKVLSHATLLKEIWGPTFTESTHYLRIYVGRLRQKLEKDAAHPEHILTETGIGYRFEH